MDTIDVMDVMDITDDEQLEGGGLIPIGPNKKRAKESSTTNHPSKREKTKKETTTEEEDEPNGEEDEPNGDGDNLSSISSDDIMEDNLDHIYTDVRYLFETATNKANMLQGLITEFNNKMDQYQGIYQFNDNLVSKKSDNLDPNMSNVEISENLNKDITKENITEPEEADDARNKKNKYFDIFTFVSMILPKIEEEEPTPPPSKPTPPEHTPGELPSTPPPDPPDPSPNTLRDERLPAQLTASKDHNPIPALKQVGGGVVEEPPLPLDESSDLEFSFIEELKNLSHNRNTDTKVLVKHAVDKVKQHLKASNDVQDLDKKLIEMVNQLSIETGIEANIVSEDLVELKYFLGFEEGEEIKFSNFEKNLEKFLSIYQNTNIKAVNTYIEKFKESKKKDAVKILLDKLIFYGHFYVTKLVTIYKTLNESIKNIKDMVENVNKKKLSNDEFIVHKDTKNFIKNLREFYYASSALEWWITKTLVDLKFYTKKDNNKELVENIFKLMISEKSSDIKWDKEVLKNKNEALLFIDNAIKKAHDAVGLIEYKNDEDMYLYNLYNFILEGKFNNIYEEDSDDYINKAKITFNIKKETYDQAINNKDSNLVNNIFEEKMAEIVKSIVNNDLNNIYYYEQEFFKLLKAKLYLENKIEENLDEFLKKIKLDRDMLKKLTGIDFEKMKKVQTAKMEEEKEQQDESVKRKTNEDTMLDNLVNRAIATHSGNYNTTDDFERAKKKKKEEEEQEKQKEIEIKLSKNISKKNVIDTIEFYTNIDDKNPEGSINIYDADQYGQVDKKGKIDSEQRYLVIKRFISNDDDEDYFGLKPQDKITKVNGTLLGIHATGGNKWNPINSENHFKSLITPNENGSIVFTIDNRMSEKQKKQKAEFKKYNKFQHGENYVKAFEDETIEAKVFGYKLDKWKEKKNEIIDTVLKSTVNLDDDIDLTEAKTRRRELIEKNNEMALAEATKGQAQIEDEKREFNQWMLDAKDIVGRDIDEENPKDIKKANMKINGLISYYQDENVISPALINNESNQLFEQIKEKNVRLNYLLKEEEKKTQLDLENQKIEQERVKADELRTNLKIQQKDLTNEEKSKKYAMAYFGTQLNKKLTNKPNYVLEEIGGDNINDIITEWEKIVEQKKNERIKEEEFVVNIYKFNEKQKVGINFINKTINDKKMVVINKFDDDEKKIEKYGLRIDDTISKFSVIKDFDENFKPTGESEWLEPKGPDHVGSNLRNSKNGMQFKIIRGKNDDFDLEQAESLNTDLNKYYILLDEAKAANAPIRIWKKYKNMVERNDWIDIMEDVDTKNELIQILRDCFQEIEKKEEEIFKLKNDFGLNIDDICLINSKIGNIYIVEVRDDGLAKTIGLKVGDIINSVTDDDKNETITIQKINNERGSNHLTVALSNTLNKITKGKIEILRASERTSSQIVPSNQQSESLPFKKEPPGQMFGISFSQGPVVYKYDPNLEILNQEKNKKIFEFDNKGIVKGLVEKQKIFMVILELINNESSAQNTKILVEPHMINRIELKEQIKGGKKTRKKSKKKIKNETKRQI